LTRVVGFQARHPVLQESLFPMRDRGVGGLQLGCDLTVRRTIG